VIILHECNINGWMKKMKVGVDTK